jgi:hypothetical protein
MRVLQLLHPKSDNLNPELKELDARREINTTVRSSPASFTWPSFVVVLRVFYVTEHWHPRFTAKVFIAGIFFDVQGIAISLLVRIQLHASKAKGPSHIAGSLQT